MANENQRLYTQQGYNELIEELKYLKGEKRDQIKQDLEAARSFGDLSENAEYDAARNEQAKVEARIK
ncbi:MAG: transcription elongation factor GreA, partial [Clostridia bacterium]|nr:transcription elongation factor GreA [Clostridia bacterium]